MVAFVDAHRDRWAVAAMCTAIALPERSYYAAKARLPSARSVSDAIHRVHVRRVWENNYRCYGARRVHKQLRRDGHEVARCTVARLMGDMGIHGVQRDRKRFTTVPDTTAARPPDLVERRFVAARPDALWLADITYASTWQGWLYVSFILDVYSRAIVGWQIADHLRTDLVLDALEMAIWRRDLTGAELVHHSDACSQTRFKQSSHPAADRPAGRPLPHLDRQHTPAAPRQPRSRKYVPWQRIKHAHHSARRARPTNKSAVISAATSQSYERGNMAGLSSSVTARFNKARNPHISPGA
jgi:transposase InsO family protein